MVGRVVVCVLCIVPDKYVACIVYGAVGYVGCVVCGTVVHIC